MAQSEPNQLPLDLTFEPSYAREDFFEGSSNAKALRAIDTYDEWVFPGLILVGPQASGKTHLVGVWCEATGGQNLRAGDRLFDETGSAPVATHMAIEDVGSADRPMDADPDVFRLLNLCMHGQVNLLITSRTTPSQWTVSTDDVRSRLRAFPVITIGPPDDSLLTAVMMKQFADLQIEVSAAAILFVQSRLERTYEAVADFVLAAKRLCGAKQRSLTLPLARDALEQMSQIGQSHAG